MSSIYICPHCGEILDVMDLCGKSRPGNDYEPYEEWAECPVCGEEINDSDEVKTCQLCGELIIHEETKVRKGKKIVIRTSEGDLCDDCKRAIDRAFNRIFDEFLDFAEPGKTREEVHELVMDRAEEMDFYWKWTRRK